MSGLSPLDFEHVLDDHAEHHELPLRSQGLPSGLQERSETNTPRHAAGACFSEQEQPTSDFYKIPELYRMVDNSTTTESSKSTNTEDIKPCINPAIMRTEAAEAVEKLDGIRAVMSRVEKKLNKATLMMTYTCLLVTFAIFRG